MARNFSEDGAVGAGQVPSGNFGEGPASGTNSTLSGFSNNDSGMFGGSDPSAPGISNTFNGQADGGAAYNPSTGMVSGSDAYGRSATGHSPVSGDTGQIGLAQTSTGDHGFFGEMNPAGLSFADGGAIPEGDEDDPNATDPQGSALGQSLQNSINAAMQSVQQALSYGRNLHGLGGGQQEAAAMPSVPGNQSESGIPRERPMPGPLPPTSTPFGKRADAGAIDDGDTENAAMPSVPFSESQRPQPTPGPLPPTSNPFGKRGQQTSDAGSDAAPDQAIDDSEEAA